MIRSRSFPFSKGLLATLAIYCIGMAQAQELGQGVQAHGFVSQSLVYTSDNNVGGHSDDGLASNMRELGANLSWRANPDWLISGQVLARWAGASDEGDLRLDYGFVDHTLSSNGEDKFGVRLGKIKNPYGFYNTTRDVAHTRPGILLPQAVYIDELRNTFLAAPGISFNGNNSFQNSLVEWSVNLIRPDVDARSLTNYMLTNQPGHFEGAPSWLAQSLWEREGGAWRVGLTLGNIKMKYKPTPIDVMKPGQIALQTGVLSLEHNRETWSITSEYSLARQDRGGFLPFFPGHALDTDTTVEAGYLQGSWRFAPRWQAYLRYEALYLDRDDRNGRKFNKLPGGAGVPAIQRFSRDKVLGIRFDPDTSWALSAELHVVDGTAWLPRIDNPAAQMEQHWNMVLLQAARRF